MYVLEKGLSLHPETPIISSAYISADAEWSN